MGCGSDGGSASSSAPTAGSSETGTGGSTARMTIAGQYLYAISGRDIQLYDIATASSPSPWSRVTLDWGIETLFPHGDALLVGADNGMYVLDNTQPASPRLVGTLLHALSRDPVVAQGNIAYVTLRRDDTNPFMTEARNELQIVDISDLTAPRLLATHAMQGPSGLAVYEEKLFICDASAGLKIFDKSDVQALILIDRLLDVDCHDVIVQGERLLVMTENQILQFDHSQVPALLLSRITTP